MRRAASPSGLALVVAAGCACGCAGEADDGPYDRLALDARFAAGLAARADVARDRDGVAHVTARGVGDLGYVHGYVVAHDRLAQLDLLRRRAAGTLAELDPAAIDDDLAIRVHQLVPRARASWDALQAAAASEEQAAADDHTNRELVELLARYSDGINAYVADLRAGVWQLDPAIAAGYDPAAFAAWSPVDSLAIARHHAWAAQWSAPYELALHELYQGLRVAHPSGPRAALAHELLAIAPVAALGGRATVPAAAVERPAGPGATLPMLDAAAIARARSGLARTPRARGSAWAVGPGATGGDALLGGAPQAALDHPSALYPTHLTIPGALDAIGVALPGVPGLLHGSNGAVAWTAAPVHHDTSDLYAEPLAACAAGTCVAFAGGEVAVETVREDFAIGTRGAISERFTAAYQRVPHHGPLLPAIVDHRVVPHAPGDTAISVRTLGADRPTFELRALWRLARATTVDDGLAALATDEGGGWLLIDSAQQLAWTAAGALPVREATATGWHASARPDAAAPFFVLPGDGGGEWLGEAAAPELVARDALVIAADADPSGATFDGDPLNQARYLGLDYADGARHGRIAALLAELVPAGADLAAVQHDGHATLAALVVPALRDALAALDGGAAPADATAFVAALSPADRALLASARDLLAGWRYTTATTDAAPALVHAWIHHWLAAVVGDEVAGFGFDLWQLGDDHLARIVGATLAATPAVTRSAATGQPLVCDRVDVAGPDDSCTRMALATALAAMQQLASPAGFGGADIARWQWGRLHRLTLPSLVPGAALGWPVPGETAVAGFARAGDGTTVDGSDASWRDAIPAPGRAGAALRFLATATPGAAITVRWQLPGGAIYDRRSAHDRDLLDATYLPQHHRDAAFTVAEVVAHGEHRWEFH